MSTRMVEIRAETLADLCDLAELAAKFREDEHGYVDSLTSNLRGCVREVRFHARLRDTGETPTREEPHLCLLAPVG